MADTAQSLIDSAEQAAKAGDYKTAEGLLREAADLQESGPPAQRAELANTLNNLGVVCELTDNPVEAERCFRRAYQIAVDVLDPNHPFVTTARKNLEDFCAANGKDPFPPGKEIRPKRAASLTPEPTPDLVTAPPLTDLLRDLLPPLPPEPAEAPAPPPQAAVRQTPSAPVQAAPSVSSTTPEVTPGTGSRGLALALIAVAVLFALFLARSLFLRSPATRDIPAAASSGPASQTAPAPSPSPTPAPVREPGHTPANPAASVARPSAPEPKPKAEPKAKEAATPKSTPPAATRPGATAEAGGLALVSGELCRSLRTGAGEWRCEAAGTSVGAGQLFFYTRVKSAREAVVQHRWYRGNELLKSVDLTIAANPGTGYRTYSRNTVSPGEWRVEVRTKSGAVLHEERFNVH